MGVYPDALSYYLAALKICTEEKNNDGLATAYIGIGNVYKDEGNYTDALSNYLKALQVNTTANRKRGMAVCYGNMGIVYGNMKDHKQSLNFYLQALGIDRELNNRNDIAADMTNIGNEYEQQASEDTAMQYYKNALELYTATGNRPGISVLTGNIGTLYYKQKNNEEAEKYLSASMSVARSIGDLKEEKQDYLVLSALFSAKGDWARAYQFHVQYTNIQDSLAARDDTKKIVTEAMNYEFLQKQAAEKEEQEKKDVLRKEESSRQKIIIFLVAAIAVIIALIALFIFRLLKEAQRKKLIAEQQKSLMELKALRAQMNPHFIFNAINSIQHFILKEDSDGAQKHLGKFSKLIRKVLENSKRESISLTEEIQMLELYAELEAVRFSSRFHYKFIVHSDLNPLSIMVPPLLIQPFVENAIWHGLMHLKERQGELIITFGKENNMLKCTIEDNGIGRKSSQDMKEQAVQHEPMGLSITQERMDILNQVYKTNISLHIADRTNPDGTSAGTSVTLMIPLSLNNTANA